MCFKRYDYDACKHKKLMKIHSIALQIIYFNIFGKSPSDRAIPALTGEMSFPVSTGIRIVKRKWIYLLK